MKKSQIKKYKEFIKESFSEFNLQRMNSDTVRPSVHVDDPSLSTNAFDKHQDMVRQALSRIGDISKSVYGSSSLSNLKSVLSLKDQDVTKLRIKRAIKSEGLNYNVYISFNIGDQEYWGVVKNIFTTPEIKSEAFSDKNLILSTEWIVKTKGIILKLLKRWFMPQFGKYRLLSDDIKCFSLETGKMIHLKSGSEIEILKSYDNQIIFNFEGENYSLKGDDFVYFNWRFEQILDDNKLI
jgi:hypothetical protein